MGVVDLFPLDRVLRGSGAYAERKMPDAMAGAPGKSGQQYTA